MSSDTMTSSSVSANTGQLVGAHLKAATFIEALPWLKALHAEMRVGACLKDIEHLDSPEAADERCGDPELT